jgi:hypothetical protein
MEKYAPNAIRSNDLIVKENEDGTITAVLSTNAPVLEAENGPKRLVIWDHRTINQERFAYGIGLYAEHNYAGETLGIIDNFRLDDTQSKLLGDIRFRDIQKAQEYRRDILNGTVRGISAGADFGKAVAKRIPGKDGNPDTILIQNWGPTEASLTNRPMDIKSGFGFNRSIDSVKQEIDLIIEEEYMDGNKPVDAVLGDEPDNTGTQTQDDAIAVPSETTKPVKAASDVSNIQDVPIQTDVNELVLDTSNLDINDIPATPILETNNGEKRTMSTLPNDSPLSQVVKTDSDSLYNFGSALRAMYEGKPLLGAEAEYQQEAEQKYGSLGGSRLYLNSPALAQRTMTTTSASATIAKEIGGNFGMLFPESVFGALGVQVKKADGPVTVAFQLTAPTVAARAENDATGTVASDLTYSERLIKLVTSTAKVIISQDALTDSNVVNLESDIRTSLQEQIRVSVEKSAFGFATAPTAAQNAFGIYQAGTKVAWGASPTAGDLALTTTTGVGKLDALTGTIEDANAGIGDVSYFVRPADYNKLKYVVWQGSNGAKMLLQDGFLAGNAPVVKASKDILGLAPTAAGDNDTTCTSTIVACKKGAITLYELSAPVIKLVEDENLVSKGLVCFHISYRYAAVLNRPEFATFLNVKL